MAFPGFRGKTGRRGLAQRLRPVTDADDEAAVAGLYREYHRPLLSLVLRQTGGDRQWAEDVVQETMIRAWRSMDQLDPEAPSLLPWLATVARRIVIDDRRRKGARPAELGIRRAARLELVLNLRTARALAVRVPSSLLQRADRVIE